MLLVLAMLNDGHKVGRLALVAGLAVLLGACGGSEPAEQAQAQVVSVAPTPVPTTPPLAVPTVTPVPTPTAAVLPAVTATPLPTATVIPSVQPTSTPEPTPPPAETDETTAEPTAVAAAAEDPTPEPTATPTPEPTSTAAPTPSSEAGSQDAESQESGDDGPQEPTPVPAAPTAVVATGELPLECYDPVVFVYRGFVEGVDALSFEAGKVTCTGAGTNRVAADRSYRHSSDLVVRRNGNFIFNQAGTAYIPYSGTMHFCMGGQAASSPVRADTVPALLIVIDNEARRLIGEGVTGPTSFTGAGGQC